MFVRYLLLTLWPLAKTSTTIKFDDYDDVGLLNCNWAAAYMSNEEIVNNPEIQHEIMLLASHWEGRFGRHGVSADLEKGFLLGGSESIPAFACIADYDSGLIHHCTRGLLDMRLESYHLALLAMALNESPYACQFFRSCMQSYWNETLETFLIAQLTKKISFFEQVNQLYPGLGGVLYRFEWNEETPYPFDNVLPFELVGYIVWPMLAISRVLRKSSQTIALGQQYENFVRLIADNFLLIFYRGNGKFNWMLTVNNASLPPSASNFDEVSWVTLSPFDNELTLYFAYFFVNWTLHGGDAERQKMWYTLRRNIRIKSYNIDANTSIEVEECDLYASQERNKYLYLPYLDVDEQERLHYAGELARTHNSASKQIPGLFTIGWKYTEANYQEELLYCGITDLGSHFYITNCLKSAHVCPSAAFPMIMNPKTRGIGLVWYLTMLRSPKMQGPFGASACAKLPGTSVSLSLKWDSKLPQLLAFGGGLASIITEVLNETGYLADFYAVVLENIAIFRNSSNFNVSHELFMPTAELNGNSQRFNACSAQDYVRSKITALPRLEQNSRSKILLYVSLALAVLVTVAVTICVLANVHYKQVVRNKKKAAVLKTHRQRKRNDDVWNVQSDDLLINAAAPIGTGAFAVVFKGFLKELPPILRDGSRSLYEMNWSRDKQMIVAVKCPHNQDMSEEFDREIEFMKTIGYHSRLVNMLAFVSDADDQKLVLEYCANGDLLCYLREIHEQLKTEIVEAPNFLSFAWQINEGMIYLSSKNCIHRDLSARNILLTDCYCAKISDFGLARQLINNEYKSDGGMLPFRIMSPEAISRAKFSVKSDVYVFLLSYDLSYSWAYGVLLYEIFSLGDTPYSNMSEASILQFLIAGNRLQRPKYATDSIDELMKFCWQFEAHERPCFEKIGHILRVEMETNCAGYGYLSVDSTDENVRLDV